jgi:uncharacterized protein YbcC (UPF0753/DUF2309 family)
LQKWLLDSSKDRKTNNQILDSIMAKMASGFMDERLSRVEMPNKEMTVLWCLAKVSNIRYKITKALSEIKNKY